MNLFVDCILDALHDTWTMVPLLYIAYLILEYYERRPAKDDSIFFWLQKYGPLFGALLGLVPQCGFSILAAMLFVENYISLGTLLAVFIATSDEAIPVLISEPSMLPQLALLLVCKFVIAVAVGFFCDRILWPGQNIVSFDTIQEEEPDGEMVDIEEEEFDEGNTRGCSCCYPQYPMWISAALRTLRIYVFVFLTTVVLNLLLAWIGADRLGVFLLRDNVFQPVMAALFGFIPNCAATVVLCQLFVAGQLSFGSLLSGLITNAGMGLVCLFEYGASRKNIIRVISVSFLTAVISGILISLL